MCPACISNIALAVAAGLTSTGALTAFIVKKLRSKSSKDIIPTKESTGEQYENKFRGNQNDLSENRNAK